jgi:hypothetical protein
MNRLFLILITLLVATQSYAQSVKFEFNAKESVGFPKLSSCNVTITSSIPLMKMGRGGDVIQQTNFIEFDFKYKPLGGFDVKGNEAKLEMLYSILKKLTKSENINIENDDFFTRTFHNIHGVAWFVERTLIKHGFAVTVKETPPELTDHKNYDRRWIYYFFKP